MRKILQNEKLRHNAILFLGSVGILFTGIIILLLFSLKIPDFSNFEERKISNSTKIYDRTGEVLLYDIHQDIKRTNISFDQMGAHIKNATVAIEDSEFYNHGGVRITSTIRAILSNTLGFGIGGGGSTITQQLVKNTLLKSESGFQRYVRKVKEWVLAIKIEKMLSKEKILEHYLNEVPYGGTVYGIEAAANTYFDKRAIDLTLAESAYLAAIPQAPTILSPYGKNKARLESRKNLVLKRMLDLGYINKEQYTQAKGEVVTFVPQATAGIKAPHFVFFVREYLEEKYGADAVENGGLKVITTLDAELQEQAEKIVKEGALENEKNWGGRNAALVAVDPRTGQILSMVGSRDYFDKTIEGNYNVATAERQPGSAFKPFIYATAFNKGFTHNTILYDIPTEFQTTCDYRGKARSGYNQDDCYMPQNYDGKFRGPMTLRNALAQSINVPAVKLFYLAGTRDSLKTAENMGITTLKDPDRYGLTLVIGGGEVTLLDLTSAYSVFANGGVRNPYTGVLRIENFKGQVVEMFQQPEQTEVLPKNTALTISDILSDNVARTPTFGANSPLYIPGRDVAVKTGTTNSNRDAWTVGYTPSIAVGVWVGNNNNTPMKKGGAALAGPIWNKFMNAALARIPNESFEEPDLTPDPNLKPILRGSWAGLHSILHWVDRNDVTGPPPEDPTRDPQYRNWEAAVQSYGGNYSFPWLSDPYAAPTTTSTDPNAVEPNAPSIHISSPNPSMVYGADQRIELKISDSGLADIQKIEVFVNGQYMDSLTPPFRFSFTPKDVDNLQTVNELRVIYFDSLFNRGEASTSFRIGE